MQGDTVAIRFCIIFHTLEHEFVFSFRVCHNAFGGLKTNLFHKALIYKSQKIGKKYATYLSINLDLNF